VRGKSLANLVRKRADDGPDCVVGIGRLQGQVEANEFLVALHELERLSSRADFFGDAVHLVIENIAEAFGEDERENVILKLGRVLGAANGTRGIPYPGFERLVVTIFHSGFLAWGSSWSCTTMLNYSEAVIDYKGEAGITTAPFLRFGVG
jgi:hypothetical protein